MFRMPKGRAGTLFRRILSEAADPDGRFALDGESNWLEGALLVIVYLILAAAFSELV
jgi:hypothetical protein